MEVPDRWFVLEVPAPPRGEEHLLVEALLRLGSRSVEREGRRYLARLPPPDDVEALLREAEAVLAASTSTSTTPASGGDSAGSRGPASGGDSASSRGPGARGGDRGGARAPDSAGDPSGSGSRRPRLRWRWEGRTGAPPAFADHPTTRTCLAFLEKTVRKGDRVADVGAGTGTLSLEAARLGAREVVALERDPLAAAVAREAARKAAAVAREAARNPAARDTSGATTGQDAAARNAAPEEAARDQEAEAPASILVLELDVGPADLGPLGPFDGIVANLEGDTLLTLLEAFGEATARGGWLILSGAHRGEGARIGDRAAEAGLRLEEEEVLDGWWTGRFRK